MFSTSVRRALLKVSASPISATFSSSTAKAVVSQYRPQRRYSSSNPSSPANGAKADGQPLQPARASRRKAKEVLSNCTTKVRDDIFPNLPSVPSTGHLKSEDVTASNFFSLHRPMSVTEVWPRAISDEGFSNIFARYTRETKTSDVIGTLSSAIAGLDTALRKQIPFEDSLQRGLTTDMQAESSHAGAHTQTTPPIFIPFPPTNLSNNFMPYNPPPPPRPMQTEQLAAANQEAANELSKSAQQTKTYHALITVEQSQDENGDVQYKSYASDFVPAPLKEPESPPRYIERVRSRRYGEDRRSELERGYWEYQAISVKRQRKLKMKKHKYKKLQRKTRNERRRQDRT